MRIEPHVTHMNVPYVMSHLSCHIWDVRDDRCDVDLMRIWWLVHAFIQFIFSFFCLPILLILSPYLFAFLCSLSLSVLLQVVWHDSSIRDITHMWHAWTSHVTHICCIHMWHSYVTWHMWHYHVTWLVDTWHDSVIYDMPPSYVTRLIPRWVGRVVYEWVMQQIWTY